MSNFTKKTRTLQDIPRSPFMLEVFESTLHFQTSHYKTLLILPGSKSFGKKHHSKTATSIGKSYKDSCKDKKTNFFKVLKLHFKIYF